MDPRLLVHDPQGRRTVPIDKPLFTIGRRTAADLYIVSGDVSRDHAEIAREGDQYILRDRGSRYGTFVNGEPVATSALRHGDRIRLGRSDSVELVYQTDPVTVGSSLKSSGPELADLRQMAAILNGLRALGSGRVLEEVLTLVVDSALEVTHAERGFVMLANERGDLEFRVARTRDGATIEGPSFATSAKIPRDVFATGRTQLVTDLVEGLPAGTHDGTIAVGIRHVLCVPLRLVPIGGIGGSETSTPRVMGVLYLDGRERTTMLSKATLASLEAFATQAALAIDSARLYAESAEKARIEHDLRIAAEIQRALLPEPVYERAALELAAASVPCRTVGGDFFDYLEFGDGAFGFALGDVAGKGAPAALLATAVQSHFVALAPVCADPAEIMARVNRALLRRAVEARFATMFGGVVAGGRLRYANAGQEPPCLLRGESVSWLDVGGPVLGLLEQASYDFGECPLEPGDLIAVVSDGVTEARNAGDEEFGRERVVEVVRRCRQEPASGVLETLLAEVRRFAEGTAQGDDITALVLRYRG